MRVHQNWTFVAAIVFGLVLAPIAVTWLTYDLIGRVSTGANAQDHERTRQVLGSALSALHGQMSAVLSDNALWDDAVRNNYGTLNPRWMEETWNIGTELGSSYNAMMLVDVGQDQVIAGYKDGKPFVARHDEYFGSKLRSMLESLPADHFRFETRTSVLKTADGVALVGLAPLLPTSEDVRVPQDRPRYLVLLRFLNQAFIAALGDQYVIADLAFTDVVAPGVSGEPVKDLAGDTVGVLTWTDSRPGDVARTPVLRKASAILAFMFAVMLGAGLMCIRLYALLAERERRARRDALCDSLTGLPNRAALVAGIGTSLGTAGTVVSVAFVDLDGFKEVNDTYDHETGDRLIRVVAAGMQQLCLRQGVVHRLGGDEFIVMFSGTDAQQQATDFARQVILFLSMPFDFEGRMIVVGASIGVATASSATANSVELLRQADVAMYQAKSNGKNQYQIYSATMDAARAEKLSIAGELSDILRAGKLQVAYQPIFSASSKEIVGVEALARWPSDSPREAKPDTFIRVAEASGLIDSLGDAVLAKACADAFNFPGLRLSLNVSPVQLNNPNFVPRTLQIIRRSGIEPHRIEVEITEGTLLTDMPKAQAIFAELRKAGISVALDDFGAGYSSIAYLRALQFDRIKIDKSLVDRILSGTSEQNIVQGAIRMAAGLTGLVTAEGIEREEQVNLLRLYGCTEMQGYYFSRPVAAEAIASLLTGPGVAGAAALPSR